MLQDGWMRKTQKDYSLYELPRAVKFIELEEWCPSPRGPWIPETKVPRPCACCRELHNPALKIQFSEESGKWQLWEINSVWPGEEATRFSSFPIPPPVKTLPVEAHCFGQTQVDAKHQPYIEARDPLEVSDPHTLLHIRSMSNINIKQFHTTGKKKRK